MQWLLPAATWRDRVRVHLVWFFSLTSSAFQTWKIQIWSTLSLPSLFFRCLRDSELCFPESQNSVNNLHYVRESFYHRVIRKPFPALVLRSLFHCHTDLTFCACLWGAGFAFAGHCHGSVANNQAGMAAGWGRASQEQRRIDQVISHLPPTTSAYSVLSYSDESLARLGNILRTDLFI